MAGYHAVREATEAAATKATLLREVMQQRRNRRPPMQLTVHDHWLLQTFPQGDAGERSEAEKWLPPNLTDALDRARRIQANQEPMAKAERAVIETSEAWCDHGFSPEAGARLNRVVRKMRRLRAAQASKGSGT